MKTIALTFMAVILLLGFSVFTVFNENIKNLFAMTCGCPIGPPAARVAHAAGANH